MNLGLPSPNLGGLSIPCYPVFNSLPVKKLLQKFSPAIAPITRPSRQDQESRHSLPKARQRISTLKPQNQKEALARTRAPQTPSRYINPPTNPSLGLPHTTQNARKHLQDRRGPAWKHARCLPLCRPFSAANEKRQSRAVVWCENRSAGWKWDGDADVGVGWSDGLAY